MRLPVRVRLSTLVCIFAISTTPSNARVSESKEVFDAQFETDDVRDALIICIAQKIEHYEIALYGTLRACAELMGLKEILKVINRTLAEEKSVDETLSDLALRRTNSAANIADAPKIIVVEIVETF